MQHMVCAHFLQRECVDMIILHSTLPLAPGSMAEEGKLCGAMVLLIGVTVTVCALAIVVLLQLVVWLLLRGKDVVRFA